MVTDIEMGPAEATEALERLSKELHEFASGFVHPRLHTELRDKEPFELYLTSSGSYHSNGESSARLRPHFIVNSVLLEHSYEAANYRQRGQRGYVPHTKTVTVPSANYKTQYDVHIARSERLGLIAVSFQEPYRPGEGKPFIPASRIRDEKQQVLLGKAFALTALKHSLNPDLIS